MDLGNLRVVRRTSHDGEGTCGVDTKLHWRS